MELVDALATLREPKELADPVRRRMALQVIAACMPPKEELADDGRQIIVHGFDGGEQPPMFSEIELADRFVRQHASAWRYCATSGRWLIWDGQVWSNDDTLRAFDEARIVCKDAAAELEREVAADTDDDGKARRAAAFIASAKTVAAVEKLARADRVHALQVDQLDADPFTLNTRSGLVDLRTGKIRAHDSLAYCTKITGAGIGSRCDAWRNFLGDVTSGDAELAAYLQRWAGYCATGTTREHAFGFVYGPGGNGKSVFANVLMKALGDYAVSVPADTFIATSGDRHPTDLAMLRGARLAVATETEDGKRWAESKLKALTGGDKIAARYMRQDYFEYTPQFKLFVIGNVKPGLRNTDEAMRRRLHLIPFTFRPARADKMLSEKLEAELDGILGWILEGCRAWQQHGLRQPAIVKNATEEYFAAEDSLGRWIADALEEDRGSRDVVSTVTLFENWTAWAGKAGEHVGSMKRFSENLSQRGFERGQDSRTRRTGFRGLRLLDSSCWRTA